MIFAAIATLRFRRCRLIFRHAAMPPLRSLRRFFCCFFALLIDFRFATPAPLLLFSLYYIRFIFVIYAAAVFADA